MVWHLHLMLLRRHEGLGCMRLSRVERHASRGSLLLRWLLLSGHGHTGHGARQRHHRGTSSITRLLVLLLLLLLKCWLRSLNLVDLALVVPLRIIVVVVVRHVVGLILGT